MKNKIILALLIVMLPLVASEVAGMVGSVAVVTRVKAIEISPTETVIKTQAQEEIPDCEKNTPSFTVQPDSQEGKPGEALVYDLKIENNDVDCYARSFLITGQAPLVNGEMWDIHFYIYGANHYPDGERRSNFILDSQESPTVKMEIASRSTWPAGEYLHYVDLHYGEPGEEIHLDYTITRNLTYKVILGTEKCPEGCICEGEVIKCPVKPVCKPPCVQSGDTCVCPPGQIKTCPVGCICEGETTTCPAEPSCEPPCVLSGNTCVCPPLPTKICKVGCICEDDEMICPAEIDCEPPCTQTGDTCTCPVEPTDTCPVDCVCEEDTIRCPTTETKPIEVEVISAGELNKISIEKIQDELTMKTEKAVAVTSEKLIVEENKLSIETIEGRKEVKVLPEIASEKAIETGIQEVKEIELKEEAAKPIYSVTGTKRARLLFLFPVTLEIKTKVDAQTSEVISVKKPWWSFLAW